VNRRSRSLTPKRWRTRGLLALVLGLLCFGAEARPEAVSLQARGDFYQSLRPYLEYLNDETAALTIDDVSQSEVGFAPVTTKYIDFGLTQGRIWLRFSLSNDTAEGGVWRLDLARQYMQELDIYLAREGEPPEIVFRHTDKDNFKKRPIASRYLATDIELAPLESVDVYIGYRSTTTTFLPVAIASLDAAANERAAENTVNWLVNGALMAMIALAILMTPLIGWRTSAAFCLYIFGGTLYVFHADGYTFQYFFADRPGLNDPLNLSFMLLMPIFGLSFARILFDLKTIMPLFDKVLLGVIITAVVFSVLTVPMIKFDAFMVAGYWLLQIGVAVQVTIGVRVFRRGVVGATPYLIGACFVVASLVYAGAAHLVPGHFDLDATLDFGHVVLLIESLAFASAIVLRLLAVRKERDQALQAELAATQEKLSLSTALRKSQDDYNHARKVSDLRRVQLSSVSHDLQQPLASLRHALDRIGGADEQASEQMRAAFDYLESLACKEIKKDVPNATNENRLNNEVFPLRAVLDNVHEMFNDEAAAKKLSFRYKPSDTNVHTDAIALMRAVNNLVSNAIKHTDSGGVLLACRQRGDKLRIEVWDTGKGMTPEQLEAAMIRHNKGEQSTGAGLGLAIVSEIAQELGLSFEMHSRPGKGSVAFLYLPLTP